MEMKKQTILRKYEGLFLLLGCFLIWGLVDYTKLGTYFLCEFSEKALGPLLKYGRAAKDPELRFCFDRVLPVQRVTLLLGCSALACGWYWLVRSFRNKISWRQIAGGVSGVSLSAGAVACFAWLSSSHTLDPRGYWYVLLIQPCLSYRFIWQGAAFLTTFFGAGKWRIAFVLALACLGLIWP